MATFPDVHLNAIEKKILIKQAEDIYKCTNCEDIALSSLH